MNAITVEHVTKHYKVFYEKNALIRAASSFITAKKRYEYLRALDDISLEVEKGEVLGIIGRNGSGKSSLLRLLAGVSRPDRGRIVVDGQVSALLDLGIGFHGELSGRENIYVTASLLGMSRKEMDKRFDGIVAFSEIGRFIDAPLQTYSSGMFLRLGFALAVHVDFDILLIDEILAVGDSAFQQKCIVRMDDFKRNGKTIVYVSHDLANIEHFCDRGIVLHNGQIAAAGPPSSVIERYRRDLCGMAGAVFASAGDGVPAGHGGGTGDRWGTGEITIEKVITCGETRDTCAAFVTGRPWIVQIHYSAQGEVAQPVFGLGIHRSDGTHIAGPNMKGQHFTLESVSGTGVVEYVVDRLPLLEGDYLLTAAVHSEDFSVTYDYHNRMYHFQVGGNREEERYGLISFPGRWQHNPNIARVKFVVDARREMRRRSHYSKRLATKQMRQNWLA